MVYELKSNLITEVNHACCKLFGCSRQELIGQSLDSFIHPDYLKAFKEFTEKAKTQNQFQGQFLCLKHTNTASFNSQIFATTLSYRSSSTHLLMVIQDVTQQIETYQLLEQMVAARTQELSTLLEISQQIVATLDLKALENVVFKQLKRIVNYTGAMLFSYKGNELELLFKQAPLSEEQAMVMVSPLEHLAIANQLLQKRKPLIIADVQEESGRTTLKLPELGESHTLIYSYVRSQMFVPLVIKDKVIGVISLVYHEPNYYTEEHANLVLTIGNQVAVALENIRLYQHARELATLQERRRVARELHDSTSQVLTSILLVSETARSLVEQKLDEPDQLLTLLSHVVALAEGGLEEMRTLIYELRPETLAKKGLVAALKGEIGSLRSRHGIEVTDELNVVEMQGLSLIIQEALYWIAREALHNVVKHAHATSVKISIQCPEENKSVVVMKVSDNGRGFKIIDLFKNHQGLLTIRERVAELNGILDVNSSPGVGTYLSIKLPLEMPVSEG
ncbi:histidine kinase [Candidatus Chlorohelix allophototropha]|uniref:Histidine kinase n=1 Tax=Candidatus Chlorohelix allophototropha TaxID=3003348 RepID=A0ABY9B9S1_9CHLR|nr:histidine kinase [Chloroflexota bacterium L227-S17]